MVRKLKAENTSVSISANHSTGATGAGMAKSPSIASAITAPATVTAVPRLSRSFWANQPRAGSCTTSNSRKPKSTDPRAVSETPYSST